MPHALLVDIAETMARYGRLRLEKDPAHGLILTSTDRAVLEEVLRSKKIQPHAGRALGDDSVAVHPSERGNIKQALLKLGWPAEDLAGYVDGEHHPIELRRTAGACGPTSRTRPTPSGTAAPGVVVLPCGAGKTHRRRGRDGARPGHHADPGHQHGVAPTSGSRSCSSAPR